MNKIILMLLVAVPVSCFSQGTIFPAQGFVGLGTSTPEFRFHMLGDHHDTKFGLQYNNPDLTKQANLTLWASEPGMSWTGAGIGNNVHITSSGGLTRLINVKGGSYIRLLDVEMRFNIVDLNGSNLNAMNINSLGNIGIGTSSLNRRLAVAHDSGYGQIAKFSSKLEDEEVGLEQKAMDFHGLVPQANTIFKSMLITYLN